MIAQARQLALARSWSAAATVFAGIADKGHLSARDLDLWALAIECDGHPSDAIPVLVRAITTHLKEGEPARAARAAVTLSKIELERGNTAVARGWSERARTILAETPDDAARVYLLWMQSRLASFEGNPEKALELAAAASELAEGCGEPGLLALVLSYRGFYNLALGRIEEGSQQQNHAAAIALSSQVDPITGSLVYCNILWSCRTFADWSRARQWSEGFESWCAASFAQTTGACDLHRAEIAGVQQTLDTALAAIGSALPKLSAEGSWSLGEGYRVRGDIHAMIGDIPAARTDYDQAYSLGWDAEPGNAILLFETGDPAEALKALDRALLGVSWFHLQRRGYLLVNAARIAALAGLADAAHRYLAEVEAQPHRWPQPSVQALITETKAALSNGDDHEGMRLLILARQLWTSAGIDYHAARVRLDLAKALLRQGDINGADVEMAAAAGTAHRIGSRRLLDRIDRLRAEASEANGHTLLGQRAR